MAGIFGSLMELLKIDRTAELEKERMLQEAWLEADIGAIVANAVYETAQGFVDAQNYRSLRVLGELSGLVAQDMAMVHGLIKAIPWYQQAWKVHGLALQSYDALPPNSPERIEGFREHLEDRVAAVEARIPWNYRLREPDEAKLLPDIDFLAIVGKADAAYRDDEVKDFLGLSGLGEVLEEAAKRLVRSDAETRRSLAASTLTMAERSYKGALEAYRKSQLMIPGFESRIEESLQRIGSARNQDSPLVYKAKPEPVPEPAMA